MRKVYLERFYALMEELGERLRGPRRLRDCDGFTSWPRRGIAFLFEPDETREDGQTPRVVRVCTHGVTPGSLESFWSRMRRHKGMIRGKYAGGGDRTDSPLRYLVGAALLARDGDPDDLLPLWREGNSRGDRDRLHPVECRVSDHLRNMPFLWVTVDDQPGPESDRASIKKNTVALLSNAGKNAAVVDPPSPDWLGRHAPESSVHESGLWHRSAGTEAFDADYLGRLEQYVDRM